MNRTFGCVRVVWNQTLAWRRQRYHDEHAKTSYAQASAYLSAMKATEDLVWLNEVSCVPLQQAVRHQQAAFANFFAGRARYPRFKSRAGRQSAEYTRSGFRYRDARLRLAKTDSPLAFTWSWPDIDPASIDPATAREVRSHIQRFTTEAGGAVLWTSHNMYEVAEVCDRVLFISRGRILLQGEPEALVKAHGASSLEDLFVTVANETLEGERPAP